MHRLEAGNVLCLKAFGAFFYFKFHCLTFVERFVSIHHNRGEVYENIFTGLALDKTITLRSVEPLHCSLFLHFYYLACAFPANVFILGWVGDIEIALFLLVRILVSYGRANTRDSPSVVTASSPQKKAAKIVLAASSNESEGNTRATNARQMVPRNGPFVHAAKWYSMTVSFFLTY
jgi:hypothetical protein